MSFTLHEIRFTICSSFTPHASRNTLHDLFVSTQSTAVDEVVLSTQHSEL